MKQSDIEIGGVWVFECRNQDGSLAWREEVHNAITTAGLTHLLDVLFHGGTQVTTWYIALINNTPAPSLAAGDTMGSHAGWVEYQAYAEATRQAWVEAAPSAGSIATSAAAVFTMNASGTLYGANLTSSSSKGGTSGTLFCTGAFSSPQAVVDTQVVNVSYSCSAANAA